MGSEAMSDTAAIEAPTLQLTAFPDGPGPYDRWELTVQKSGRLIAHGSMPLDHRALSHACHIFTETYSELDQKIDEVDQRVDPSNQAQRPAAGTVAFELTRF